MAAYAATVALNVPHVVKQVNGLMVAFGTVNLTNYNTTRTEITAITSLFKTGNYVVLGGDTDSGWSLVWNYTDKAFSAWNGITQATNDVAIGTATFIAMGIGS
jgi:hypothetical protein